MRKSILPRVAGVLAALAVVVGVGLAIRWTHRDGEPTGKLVLYGNVDIRTVELAFKDAERVRSMLVQEGDRVTKGQAVAMLETDRLRAAIARAEAQAESQRQVVARLEAGSRPEEIREVAARLAAAEARAAGAEATYQRARESWEKKVATSQELEDARAAARIARADVKAAEESLKLAVAGPRKEDIAAARAALRALEAELTLLKQQLADATLYAPADGVIQNRILEPGDMASPQRPVYSIAMIDPLWVRTYVPEPDLGRIDMGAAAAVTTDTYPGRTYRGWVGYISPTAEFTPKSVETPELRTSLVYQIRVYVENPAGELRLGMPVTVTFDLNAARRPATAPAGPETRKARE